MFYSTWIRLSYGFFDQFGYYDRYCCIINMNMFIVIFLYLCKCICIFFVPLINLMRYFVIFVMFSIIKHNSYHVMVHDWNKNILSYLILSYLLTTNTFNPHEMLLTDSRYWASIHASASFYRQQCVASKLIYLVFFGCLATTELTS